jgi:hypothetical protein
MPLYGGKLQYSFEMYVSGESAAFLFGFSESNVSISNEIIKKKILLQQLSWKVGKRPFGGVFSCRKEYFCIFGSD